MRVVARLSISATDWWLLWGAIVFHLTDAVLTVVALDRGATEANPVVRAIILEAGLLGLLTWKMVVLATVVAVWQLMVVRDRSVTVERLVLGLGLVAGAVPTLWNGLVVLLS